jgi:DNA repair exonuclease SbcCD ATPase subunit
MSGEAIISDESRLEQNIKETISKINAQIDDYNGKLNIISTGILQLKEGNATLVKQHTETNATQVMEFQKKEQDLQAKQQEMIAMQEKFNTDLQSKNEETQKMEAQIQELNSTLQTTNASNTSEKENIQQQLAAAEQVKIEQQQQLEDLKNKKDKVVNDLIATLRTNIETITQEKDRYKSKVEELLGYITSNNEQVTLLYDKTTSIGGPINSMIETHFKQQGGYNWRTPSSKTFRTNTKSMHSSSRRMSSKRSSKRNTRKYKMKK